MSAMVMNDPVAIEIINQSPTPTSARLFGVSITCDYAPKCPFPETCRHVRAALRQRRDLEAYTHIFAGPAIAPIIRCRIPLADYSWVYLTLYGLEVARIILPRRTLGEASFVLPDEFSAEDAKIWLVNYAAKNYELARHNQLYLRSGATLCQKCGASINMMPGYDDLLWVLYWADPSSLPFCWECIRKRERSVYFSRTPQDGVDSMVW